MPTYEYECLKCGKNFEAFQKITEKPLKSCPSCKGNVKKIIGTGCGLIFKGSGFYITDYKRKNTSSEGDACRGNSCSIRKSKETKDGSKNNMKEFRQDKQDVQDKDIL